MYKFSTEGMTECGYPVWGGCGYGYGHHKEGLGSNVGGTALVILLILIAIGIFWGFTSNNHKQDEKEMRIDNRRLSDLLFQNGKEIALAAKGVSDLEVSAIRSDRRLDALTADYSYRTGKIEEATRYNAALINEMSVVAAKPYPCLFGTSPLAGVAPVANGCGCGEGRGVIPEFTSRTTYVQDGTPEVIRRTACGNAFDA